MGRNKFEAGTSVKITSTIKDTDNELVTPTSVSITIQQGTSTAVIDSQSMSEESTGVYYYVWQTESDTPTGMYTVKTTAVYSGYTSVKTVDDCIYIG